MVTRALAAAVLSVLAVVPSARADEGHTIADGFPPEQRALIEWATGRFAAAGLPLPPLAFVHHAHTSGCRGAAGFYTSRTIHVCTSESDPFAETLFLHELAHAWDDHVLTEERRAAFLALRRVDRWWNDGTSPWHTYGAEHAAQVIVWGVIDRPLEIRTIPDHTCDDLRRAYRLLTGGARPPRTPDRCGGS